MTTRKQTLKAWGELALYVLAPFSMVKDIPVPNYDKSELVDILNVIKSDINEHEKLEAEYELLKKDVARYFDNLKVIDDYKHSHPNETNKELEISLEKEVALYRELFAKLRKVGKEE